MKRTTSIVLLCALLVAAIAATWAIEKNIVPAAQEDKVKWSYLYETGYGSRYNAEVVFTDDGISLSGKGAAVQGNTLTVMSSGVYHLTGKCSDARIVVMAKKANVILLMDGLDLTCMDSSPIFVYKSHRTIIETAPGTDNYLTDGKEYDYSDAYSVKKEKIPNSTVYSLSKLAIRGEGSLTVNGNFSGGICARKDFAVRCGSLSVNCPDSGIRCSKDLVITESNLRIACGGDSIHLSNKEGKAKLISSDLSIECGSDGIQSSFDISASGCTMEIISDGAGIKTDGAITMESCTVCVKSGGGSEKAVFKSDRYKGIRAEGALTLSGCSLDIDSSDDGLHSGADITLTGCTGNISTLDDGIHSDTDVNAFDCALVISKCYEGVEGQHVNLTGCSFDITSSDDGINSASSSNITLYRSGSQNAGPPSPPNGQPGGPPQGGPQGPQPDPKKDDPENLPPGISIDDGSYGIYLKNCDITVHAGGDGIDSNSTIYMEGGTLITFSTGRMDGALDYEKSFTVTDGYILAVGTAMPVAPTDSPLNAVLIQFPSAIPSGTLVVLENEDTHLAFSTPIDAYNLVLMSSLLEEGDTWSLYSGGSFDGDLMYLISSSGTYTPGEKIGDIILQKGTTGYGRYVLPRH